jgi:hypothetical protein
VPFAYLTARVELADGWDALPAAYLSFGDTYAEERSDAAARGWPVSVMAGGHLHMLHAPAEVRSAQVPVPPATAAAKDAVPGVLALAPHASFAICRSWHVRSTDSREREIAMTDTPHEIHQTHAHVHGDDCGHVAVKHGEHVDYLHEGHVHADHDGHYDECSLREHVAAETHQHVHGPDCGHASVTHADHVDYVHEGHRHATHQGHYDEH